MKTNVYTYEGDDVTVTWDRERCIHAEACVHGLPNVFDPNARPWITPDEADPEAVVDVVMACPTGALHVTRNGTNPEPTPASNHVRLFPNGPLLVQGDIKVLDSDGKTLLQDTRVALCRCGLSSNKPLCDGSHDGAFDDDGALDGTMISGDADGTGPVQFKTTPNGPFVLSGSVTIEGADGATCSGSNGALCRCGASNAKPFCDGSHSDVGFEAD